MGIGFAMRHPERIKRLVLMNTWAFAPWPGGPFPRLLEIIRSERGEAFVLRKNGYLEPALIGTTYHSEKVTNNVLDAYRAPFPTPEFAWPCSVGHAIFLYRKPTHPMQK